VDCKRCAQKHVTVITNIWGLAGFLSDLVWSHREGRVQSSIRTIAFFPYSHRPVLSKAGKQPSRRKNPSVFRLPQNTTVLCHEVARSNARRFATQRSGRVQLCATAGGAQRRGSRGLATCGPIFSRLDHVIVCIADKANPAARPTASAWRCVFRVGTILRDLSMTKRSASSTRHGRALHILSNRLLTACLIG